MLSWFREWSRPIARAALPALVTLTIASAAPHSDECHDVDCSVTLPHDPNGHRVGRSQESSGEPVHCVLCQWTRSLRPTPEITLLFAPAVADDDGASSAVFGAPSQPFLVQPALRGPPAAPGLA